MTDPWQETAPMTSSQPSRGFSPGTIALLATATVLLAVAGLAIGWYVAGPGGEPEAQASASPSVSAPASPDASPTELPSPTSEPSPTEGGGANPTMPDLLTHDFRVARTELMKQFGVSVKVEFDEQSEAPHGTVISTVPVAGHEVRRGTSVTLYVAGPHYRFPMPDLVGLSCTDGAKKLVEEGLRISRYAEGRRSGTVLATSIPKDQEVAWNDPVELTCGTPESPSPAAG
ncbi:PASTA domain-containing protein [Catellatospora sp. NPDC049609]|uniref:PASTA domain-containing protein n=1 Tax=Catellatospora sp. NPDC049609 TaxID=3155505 RepID=UPI00343DEA28